MVVFPNGLSHSLFRSEPAPAARLAAVIVCVQSPLDEISIALASMTRSTMAAVNQYRPFMIKDWRPGGGPAVNYDPDVIVKVTVRVSEPMEPAAGVAESV